MRAIWFLCAALVFFFSSPLDSRAHSGARGLQGEGEPRQSEIFILGHSADVALGQGFRLQLAFTFSPEAAQGRIASIAAAWRSGGSEITLPVDLARDVFWEPWGFNVVYNYTPGDPAGLPAPMSQVIYMWEVALDDGTRASARGEFVYADDRFAWRSTASAWLTLYTYSDTLNTFLLAQRLEPVHALLRAHTGASPAFKVVLYEPGDDFCPPAPETPTPAARDSATATATPTTTPTITPTPTPAPLPACDAGAVAQNYRDGGFIVIRRANTALLDLHAALSYAMAKAAWRAVWGEAEAPAWFAEGLAQLYEPSPHASAVLLARDAVRAGADFDAAGLQAAPTSAQSHARDPWYAQSVSMALYLVDRFGPDAPARVAAAIPLHPTFDEALAAVTGRDTGDHLARWRTWILSDAAERRATWTPYLPPTPAPTLTRTPTPTLTPRPTHTPTPTARPTRFGIPAMTPIRPTRTVEPTPRPPTNTPRPPATPTPPGGGAGGGGGLCGGATILLAPAGLVAWMARRRRK